MNPFLYFVKLVSSFIFTSTNYPAVIFDSPIELQVAQNITYITACPPSTKQEKEINDRVSLTGNSLFLRNFHRSEEYSTFKICDKPAEPGILYNLKSKLYEIGYELCYYEQDKLKWKDDVNLTQLYRQVNITRNYEVIHNDTNKNLILNDGASKLNSHWDPVLSVAYVGDNKQIQLPDDRGKTLMEVPDGELQGKCENENSRKIDMKIYVSSECDSNSNNSLNTSSPNLEQLKPGNAQSHGSLVMSQLIPLWYYRDDWSKAASCSHLNMIPVWKSIAGQLKKVDLFLQAVIRAIPRYNVETILFGASGVLTLKNETDIDQDRRQKIYLLQDGTQYRQIIPIPRIIYRVVQVELIDHEYTKYYAAIVIHNDPIHVLDGERICDESQEVSGWERIKNDDPKTGLTYVCPFNEFIKSVPILPVDGKLRTKATGGDSALTLDSLTYYSYTSMSLADYDDGTYEIGHEFDKILNVTAQL